MSPRDLKRSMTIRGHRTSVSLEREFWEQIKKCAEAENKSLSVLIAEIDAARGERNLSSSIRIHVLGKLLG